MKESYTVSEFLIITLKLLTAAAVLVLAVLLVLTLVPLGADIGISVWLCAVPSVLLAALVPGLFLHRKLRFFAVWILAAALLGLPGGMYAWERYDASIRIDITPDVDVDQHLAVTHTSWWWNGETALQFTQEDDLPRIDGDLITIPIYADFVQAVYPETVTLYGWQYEDGSHNTTDDTFQCSGTAAGYQALAEKRTDIFIGTYPSEAQRAYAREQNTEFRYTQLGYTSLVFFVHQDSPVESLTVEQIKGIYSGEITNWSQVGGDDRPIHAYQYAEGSELQNMLEYFMDIEGTGLAIPAQDRIIGPADENTYRNDLSSIGFTTAAYASELERHEDIRCLNIEGIKHNGYLYDAETGFSTYVGYPITVPLYAVTWAGNENENVQKLLDWMTSAQGQYLVLKGDYTQLFDYSSSEDDLTIDTAPAINTDEYLPFRSDSKIVKLDHEASLQLDYADLPVVDGAAAVFPVYSAFVNATFPQTQFYINYQEENIRSYQYFLYSNTVIGYKLLAQRETDIFFGAYPSDEQIAFAEERGTEFVYTPIGYEAFVFFVHKDNPIESLTTEQLKGIYSGEITNWSQVGGWDEEIVAYQRNEGSGSQSYLIRFMGDTPIMDPPTTFRIEGMFGIVESVAQYRSTTASIGFSFRYYVEELVANPDIKLLSIDGVAPTVENIKNGTYPEIGYLYAVTWAGNENENVQRLLDWVLSEEGQYIIEQTGYTPIN